MKAPGAEATPTDVAFAVCTALARSGETAVLCGGAAAAYYIPRHYQSYDLDFVLHVGASRIVLDRALATLGYTYVDDGYYTHDALPYTVEFPVGPLAIGRDLVTTWRTVHRHDELLHVLAPTDVVRDRFLHYWAWGDRSALHVAVDVARAHRAEIDLDAFRAWTRRERDVDPTYDPQRVATFFAEIAAAT